MGKKFDKILYKALMSSIGKTTIRMSEQPRPSTTIKRLRKERRELKREFEQATCPIEKGGKLKRYKDKQNEVNAQARAEEEERINRRIDIISSDRDGIWKERRRAKRGQMDDWFITKDKQGRRIYDPDENRNNIHSHYKELYELREVPYHPYHETVESTIKRLKEGTPETDPDQWPAPH